MIQDPELRAAVEHARNAWEKTQDQLSIDVAPPARTFRTAAGAFYCHDCNRRFFNKGWHAEACGSSNYSLVTGEAK